MEIGEIGGGAGEIGGGSNQRGGGAGSPLLPHKLSTDSILYRVYGPLPWKSSSVGFSLARCQDAMV